MKRSVLRQEEEVVELLKTVPSEVVGDRLSRARRRQGLSIRDLADRANVNKNSVVRLEKGGMPQPLTVVKICEALGLHVATIAHPASDEVEFLSIHRREDDRWFDLTDFAAGPLAEGPLEPKARAELGVPAQILMQTNRLEKGQLLTRIIEVYDASPARSHLGEEMVYVLEGRIRLTVGSETVDLEVGESATFWSSEQHVYAPAPDSPIPARLLSVTIHARGN